MKGKLCITVDGRHGQQPFQYGMKGDSQVINKNHRILKNNFHFNIRVLEGFTNGNNEIKADVVIILKEINI